MSGAERAKGKFLSGYNCAQSVAYGVLDRLDAAEDTVLKAACGFGAGMGRKEEVCGAVTGGIMALGLKFGRGVKETREATEKLYPLVRELMNRFEKKHGSFICRRLLDGVDLLTDEGQAKYKARDMHATVCLPCVLSAVEITESLLK
jgi:C_GCAxxG_C_C family probable redox protein